MDSLIHKTCCHLLNWVVWHRLAFSHLFSFLNKGCLRANLTLRSFLINLNSGWITWRAWGQVFGGFSPLFLKFRIFRYCSCVVDSWLTCHFFFSPPFVQVHSVRFILKKKNHWSVLTGKQNEQKYSSENCQAQGQDRMGEKAKKNFERASESLGNYCSKHFKFIFF